MNNTKIVGQLNCQCGKNTFNLLEEQKGLDVRIVVKCCHCSYSHDIENLMTLTYVENKKD